MKYLREGFESHVRIEKSQMISAESRKQLVDDPKDIAALSALNLDWYELTDVAGRSLVLVCPTGKEKQFVGENIAFFHLASLGNGNVLVSDNQLVSAFFKAKQCPEMNQSMRNQILANCEAKVKQLSGL